MMKKTLIVGVMLIGTVTLAQQNVSENDVRLSLVECSNLENSDLRFSCYENLAKKTKNGMLSQSGGAASRPMATTTQPITTEPATIGPATMEPASIEPATGSLETGATANSSQTRSTDQPQNIVSGPPSEDNDNLLTRTIERASQGASKSWYFYFSNGELWKQNDTRHRRMPDFPATATLKKGSFGGYRMKVEGESWSMKVKEVKQN